MLESDESFRSRGKSMLVDKQLDQDSSGRFRHQDYIFNKYLSNRKLYKYYIYTVES